MRNVAFVINPVSIRHMGVLQSHCRELAAANGWEPELMGTVAGESAPELLGHLSRYAEAGGDRLVFAVGGDGTVRACATALAHTGAALAIVPRGTANLFARALGVPSRPPRRSHCRVRHRRTLRRHGGGRRRRLYGHGRDRSRRGRGALHAAQP